MGTDAKNEKRSMRFSERILYSNCSRPDGTAVDQVEVVFRSKNGGALKGKSLCFDLCEEKN